MEHVWSVRLEEIEKNLKEVANLPLELDQFTGKRLVPVRLFTRLISDLEYTVHLVNCECSRADQQVEILTKLRGQINQVRALLA